MRFRLYLKNLLAIEIKSQSFYLTLVKDEDTWKLVLHVMVTFF